MLSHLSEPLTFRVAVPRAIARLLLLFSVTTLLLWLSPLPAPAFAADKAAGGVSFAEDQGSTHVSFSLRGEGNTATGDVVLHHDAFEGTQSQWKGSIVSAQFGVGRAFFIAMADREATGTYAGTAYVLVEVTDGGHHPASGDSIRVREFQRILEIVNALEGDPLFSSSFPVNQGNLAVH